MISSHLVYGFYFIHTSVPIQTIRSLKIVIYLLRILVDKQRSDYIMLSGMSEVVVCFASLDFQIYLQPLKDRQVGRRSEMLQNNTVF